MKQKQLLILLMISAMAFVVTACGNGNTQPDVPAQEADDSGLKEQEDLQAGDGQNPQTDMGGEEPDERPQISAADALAEYALTLTMCDLTGTQLIYEAKEGDGYSYFQTQGLKGLTEKKEGCLGTEIFDFDDDGEEELLTLNLLEGDEAHKITVAMYEYKDGQIAKAADTELLGYALGLNCDGAQIRFMLKDGKYICMDSLQNTFVCADGMDIVLAACYYNGAGFVKMSDFSFVGSDYGGLGAESTDFIDQLYTMKFDKAAAAVYDRDVFHFCMADEGTKPLLKIALSNSMATEETDFHEMPVATFTQIRAGEMEEEFVLPESNSRILEAFELSGMTKEQLRIARNEIYARYGWQFEDRELSDYFYGKAWYAAAENVDDTILSEMERTNLSLIVEAEKTAPQTAENIAESVMDIPGAAALTASELSEIATVLKAVDAYGFLYSFYEDVRDVDLDPVFYTGAGIVDEAFSDSVRDSYLQAANQTEFYTDFFALKEADIDALLKKRTGYGLSEMRNPLGRMYLAEKKAYCIEVGDTNYMQVSVVDGVKTEDGMYYILYENPSLEYTSDNTMCMVTLKKQGDRYLFAANKRMGQ